MECETMLKEKPFPIGLESTAILWYSFSFELNNRLQMARSAKDKKKNQKSFILHTLNRNGYK